MIKNLTITSLQNPYIKHLLKLKNEASYRLEKQKFFLEIDKTFIEIAPYLLSGTLITSNLASFKFPYQNFQIVKINQTIAEKLALKNSLNQHFLELDLPSQSSLKQAKLILALDRISDPGNLGTLLRTAISFNWDGIFLLPGCACLFNDKTLRAARGAIFKIPYKQGSFEDLQILAKNSQLQLVAADLKGAPPEKFFKSPLVLVLGNEGNGLSLKVKQACQIVSLPMKGAMESLNVAIAGAILIYLFKSNL